MAWANCGTDDLNRPIGYAFSAECDELGCNTKIHRGIAYACGEMHGEDWFSCARYFCPEHLCSTPFGSVCKSCKNLLIGEVLCRGCEWEEDLNAAGLCKECNEAL